MNKHISINIGGIIFHVEEDAFERLKSYLNKVNKYFSSYAEGDDVMSDIEARIAEFFLDRLDEYKEYITLEDVEGLQVTMGTVSDWASADEYANLSEETPATHYTGNSNEPKKLYRDEQRRLIGGVASGIAHYFSIDPLWIRLSFLLFFFDFSSFSSVTGVAIVVYAILWALLPASYNLEENDAVRRLFRDPETRVLGGVAGGIAGYFRVQPTLVRIIFILSSLLGGLGVLTYAILWAITPVAKSLTERMQMKGEPITLENIEEQIKQRFQINENEPESPLVRALLLPLRLLSSAIDRFNTDVDQTRVLQKGGHLLLFAIGSVMTLVSTVASLAMFGLVAAYFGMGFESMSNISIDGEVPLHLIQATVPASAVLFGFLIGWVPVAFLGILGMSIASRRIVTRSFVNWGLLGLWVVGIVGGALTIPMIATQFRTEGVHKQLHAAEVTYPEAFRIMVRNSRSFENGQYNEVKLSVLGHDKDNIELVQKFSSKGCSRQMAIESAGEIDYDFEMRDSTLILDPHFHLPNHKPFRAQSLWMTLYVPFGKEFVMSQEVGGVIRNTLHRHGYTVHDLGMNNRWIYQKDGLHCITCENPEGEKAISTISQADGEIIQDLRVSDEITSLSLSGLGTIDIIEGSEARVQMTGSSKDIESVHIHSGDEQLLIRNDEGVPVQIVVTIPHLNELRVEGSMNINLEDFRQENISISLSEAASLKGNIFAENVEINVREGASMHIRGAAANVQINAQEGAQIEAKSWNVENMKINAKEGAFIQLGPTANLSKNLSEGARVTSPAN